MLVKARLIQGRIAKSLSHCHQLRRDPQRAVRVSDISRMRSHFARQRDLFRNVLIKIEGLADLACLKRPGFRLLAELAREARETARRTDRELALGADPLSSNCPQPEQIEQLIEHTSDLQDRLQRQLALVAQWREDAEELQYEFELLVGQRQLNCHSLPFDGLRALARRLIAELLYDVSPPVLHPQLALDMLTERLASRAQARVFAVALASAQLVARVARVTWLNADHVELITAASLLQDCGKLVTEAKFDGASVISDPPSTLHRHARIGAAIVSHYRNAPPELPILIAQHHQRVGNMSPLNSPSSGDLPQLSSLLAAASRFERLRLALADQSTLLSAPESVDRPAISTLWQEAVDGNWDLQLVRKILVQRDGHAECMKTADATTVIRTRSRARQFVHS